MRTSSGAHSSSSAATCWARARTSRVVRATAGPAFAATRLPPVPMPIGKSWVSPATMWTSSSRTPSSAAQIWARVVWCPWPCAATPMVTNTWPLGSTRTCAPSYGPMPEPWT